MANDVFIRPFRSEDARQLDLWRRDYWDGDLEVPHGFADKGVETVCAYKGDTGRMFESLTGVLSVTLDPLIHDPEASPLDVVRGLIKMETALSYNAQCAGAVDAYIAIPQQLDKYVDLLRNYGFEVTVENCVVMRRPLRPDTVPLLGVERDKAEAARVAAQKENKPTHVTVGDTVLADLGLDTNDDIGEGEKGGRQP